LIYVEWAWQY